MPNWLTRRDIQFYHAELLARHNGLQGPAREDVLEATLARPQQLFFYEPASSLPRLAASYGYGFARNHCFPDGNKRIALAAIGVFLMDNEFEFIATEVDAVVSVRAVAAGEISEDELTEWVTKNSREIAR